MGAEVEELTDGLIVKESRLRGARVNGHFDHRIVMSLASIAAGMGAIGKAGLGGILIGALLALFGWFVWTMTLVPFIVRVYAPAPSTLT